MQQASPFWCAEAGGQAPSPEVESRAGRGGEAASRGGRATPFRPPRREDRDSGLHFTTFDSQTLDIKQGIFIDRHLKVPGVFSSCLTPLAVYLQVAIATSETPMSTAFTTSNHSAFNDMPPPQPSSSRTSKQLHKYSSDVPVTSAGVRLSFEYEYDAELAPSRPRNYIEQPLNQLSQAPNPVASTDGENSNAIDELEWAENIDEEIRRRREELERVRGESRASVFLLEDKAKGGLSPAFSPAVHDFVSLVMAGSAPSSAFPSTYPVAHKEGMPDTPNGDYLQTPSHSIFSSRAKGALGFIKDEALRLRGKKN